MRQITLAHDPHLGLRAEMWTINPVSHASSGLQSSNAKRVKWRNIVVEASSTKTSQTKTSRAEPQACPIGVMLTNWLTRRASWTRVRRLPRLAKTLPASVPHLRSLLLLRLQQQNMRSIWLWHLMRARALGLGCNMLT